VQVLRNGAFETVRWRDVIVGDILRLTDGEMVCADMMLVRAVPERSRAHASRCAPDPREPLGGRWPGALQLSTSEPHGVCFVETMSLDGETNLKVRQCPRETLPLNSAAKLSNLIATFECEAPNSRLYMFDGTLTVDSGLEPEDVESPPAAGTPIDRRAAAAHHKRNTSRGSQASAISITAAPAPAPHADAVATVAQALDGKPMSVAARRLALMAGVSQLSIDTPAGLGDDDFELLENVPAAKVLSVGPNEVVLRGSSIRNTAWVHGLVFGTGHDTKLVRCLRARAPARASLAPCGR